MNEDPDSSRPEAPNAQRGLGMGMTIAMWIIVLALMTWFFQSWQERQYNPNQKISLSSGDDGVRELVLQRNRYGHYLANGEINQQPVVFLLD